MLGMVEWIKSGIGLVSNLGLDDWFPIIYPNFTSGNLVGKGAVWGGTGDRVNCQYLLPNPF